LSRKVDVEKLSDTAVRLTIVVKRPPEAVYDAWVQPEKIAKWFIPEPGSTCEIGEFEPRIGGRFEITVDAGEPCTAYGKFLVMDRPNRLVLTWQWTEGELQRDESQITLDFVAIDEGTRFVMTHERLASVASREAHTGGWTGCMASLAAYLETQ